MRKNYLVAFAFAVRLISGREPSVAVFDKAAFRKAVEDGLPTDPRDLAVRYAVSHEEIAIPILVAAIKEKLNDRQAERFNLVAIDWATYNASERAADAVADLCAADVKRCPLLVKKLLNHGAARDRQYEIAYYTVERYPILMEPVATWVADSMKFSTAARDFAREVLKREKAGHPIRDNDQLLTRIPSEARERVKQAVETARNAGR